MASRVIARWHGTMAWHYGVALWCGTMAWRGRVRCEVGNQRASPACRGTVARRTHSKPSASRALSKLLKLTSLNFFFVVANN